MSSRERRRARRAAGPTGAAAVQSVIVASSESAPAADTTTAAVEPVTGRDRPVSRRRPNRRLVVLVAGVLAVLAAAGLGTTVALAAVSRQQITATVEREQRFVDTARQLVVNMFSYTQSDIDESVDRFVSGTSGPLRDMLSQPGNVDNLKALFRDTNASSEAVINGAALEAIDETAGNASVLVAVRVTVTDIDGINKPSQAFRMRVVVHEDDDGVMTGYDLKYPEGGN